MSLTTPTNQVGFLDKLGRYGAHTAYTGGVSKSSAQAHRQLIQMAKLAQTKSGYLNAIKEWSRIHLPFGQYDLPRGFWE